MFKQFFGACNQLDWSVIQSEIDVDDHTHKTMDTALLYGSIDPNCEV